MRPDALLFGESTGPRVIATPAGGDPDALLEARRRERGVPAAVIGETADGRPKLVARSAANGRAWIDASVEALRETLGAGDPAEAGGRMSRRPPVSPT